MSDSILTGRRALITGASSGIGSATAELLASRGAAVAVHYRSRREDADAVVARIVGSGGRAVALQADLVDKPARSALVDRAISALGGLDTLVNNAGAIIDPAPVLEVSEEGWERSFALNAEAPFFLAQRSLTHMIHEGGGKIVNISSVGVKYGGSPTSLHYSAAKAAMETAMLGLAKAGAPHRVLVNVIRPGIIDTPFHADTPRDAFEKRISLIPLGRAGMPSEVAEMVAYLVSPAGDFITGQILSISGGD